MQIEQTTQNDDPPLNGDQEDLIKIHQIDKFTNPVRTADGALRARVEFQTLETLWINTGTICNLECDGCYIESSPKNDRLAWVDQADVENVLTQLSQIDAAKPLIGFTGGEPFANPHFLAVLAPVLEQGYSTLILTNATTPLWIKRHKLSAMADRYSEQITFRVSLDHYHQTEHDQIRGKGSFAKAQRGLTWLVEQGYTVSIAGRSLSSNIEEDSQGYHAFINSLGPQFEPLHNTLTVFPEMGDQDVPEISEDCWDILGVKPTDMMCATSRMMVKRAGDKSLSIMPCTLIAYDERAIVGNNLSEMHKTVSLNHRFCAQFCVLGGSSCS